MKFFDRETILNTGTPGEWIRMMELAVLERQSPGTVLPQRTHLDYHENTFLLMPCISGDYWVTKLVSFCPGNKLSGIPSIYGTVLVCDSVTGKPLACMDGGSVTAMRTAAVSALGIKYLFRSQHGNLGIVGTGFQGLYQALFAASVIEIDKIWAYDPDDESFARFSSGLNSRLSGIKILRASDSTAVAVNSDLIITATNSANPVFNDEKSLFTGKTFIGIGSYKPGFREFPEQLFRQIDQLFVDTPDGMKESGDLITPITNNWIDSRNIFPIEKLVSGEIEPSPNTTRLFKTVGSAIFDLYAAKLVIEKHS